MLGHRPSVLAIYVRTPTQRFGMNRFGIPEKETKSGWFGRRSFHFSFPAHPTGKLTTSLFLAPVLFCFLFVFGYLLVLFISLGACQPKPTEAVVSSLFFNSKIKATQ